MRRAPVGLTPLRDATAAARLQHRDRILAVCTWALEQGRPVLPAHVALIVDAKAEQEGWNGEPLDRWTRVDVYGHLYSRMFNWCTFHDTRLPSDIPEAFWTYLHFLHEHHLLTFDSDPLKALLDPLRCYGGLGPDGTTATWRRVTCRCRVEYRAPRQPV
ncbi:MAG: hypothetical protein JO087_11295, partial [Actinobacteria bacterium]|nr:hypothetical protein [Actinomycetota bacterium]